MAIDKKGRKTSNHDNLHHQMDYQLEQMRDQINMLLERAPISPDGLDCTPVFRMAKAEVVQGITTDIKYSILLGEDRQASKAAEILLDALEMQL